MLFERLYKLALLRRGNASEDSVLQHSRLDFLHGIERTCVHIEVRVPDAGFIGNPGYCDRVIPGNNLNLHTLLRKVSKGLFRLLADGVGEQDIAERGYFFSQSLSSHFSGICSEDEDTIALFTVSLDLILILRIVVTEHKFRRAEDVGAVVKRGAAVLIGGRKGGDGARFPRTVLLEIVLQRGHGNIVSGHTGGKITDQSLQRELLLHLQIRSSLNNPVHLHGVFGDRTGLVHTEHIDAGKRLYALHIMSQNLLLCQAHNAHHKRYRREQIQALRDHADDGCDHGGHAGLKADLLYEELLGKKQNADRYNQDAHNFDQFIQRADHLGLLAFFCRLCLHSQLGDIGILTNFIQSRPALAGNDKAA